MTRYQLAPMALAASLALAACSGGARDMEYTQARGINADIAASHEQEGPTALYPGASFTNHREPLGVYPWQLDENH
jgi:hypothetical protein